jgi:hypothetical protein
VPPPRRDHRMWRFPYPGPAASRPMSPAEWPGFSIGRLGAPHGRPGQTGGWAVVSMACPVTSSGRSVCNGSCPADPRSRSECRSRRAAPVCPTLQDHRCSSGRSFRSPRLRELSRCTIRLAKALLMLTLATSSPMIGTTPALAWPPPHAGPRPGAGAASEVRGFFEGLSGMPHMTNNP